MLSVLPSTVTPLCPVFRNHPDDFLVVPPLSCFWRHSLFREETLYPLQSMVGSPQTFLPFMGWKESGLGTGNPATGTISSDTASVALPGRVRAGREGCLGAHALLFPGQQQWTCPSLPSSPLACHLRWQEVCTLFNGNLQSPDNGAFYVDDIGTQLFSV